MRVRVRVRVRVGVTCVNLNVAEVEGEVMSADYGEEHGREHEENANTAPGKMNSETTFVF